MKLIDIIQQPHPSLSFEVFPPKSDESYDIIASSVQSIAALSPSFMSVTYGAGGGTSDYTCSIAADLQHQYNIPVLAHLSCVNSSKAGVQRRLDAMKAAGIENILALRGDLASGEKSLQDWEYHYASQLIEEIRAYGEFCIGGACYPEMHTESLSQKEDIAHLKEKEDAGCEFLTTQMFFDNTVYYNFLCKARNAGITVPIVAGIMPVTNAAQIRRIISLSGTTLPQRFRYIIDCFENNPSAMKQAGIAYATEQIVDLFANGVPAVHVYTMNNVQVAAAIQSNLSEIIKQPKTETGKC